MDMGSSSGQSSQSSQQGFRDLPPEIQNSFKALATQAQKYTPSTAANVNRFTPLPQTGMETDALASIGRGFTPDQNQFNSDIAMQNNPFDSSVIDTINRQAGGDFSILKQNASQTGTFGSNRQALGANDIDLTRLNQIGTFKQNQFNTQAQNALTTMPQQRMADASAQLQGGGFLRNLNSQQNQAPLNALAAISQILGILPTNSGQSSGSSDQSSFSFGLK